MYADDHQVYTTDVNIQKEGNQVLKSETDEVLKWFNTKLLQSNPKKQNDRYSLQIHKQLKNYKIAIEGFRESIKKKHLTLSLEWCLNYESMRLWFIFLNF